MGHIFYLFWYVNMFKFLEQYKPTHFGLPSLIPGSAQTPRPELAVRSLPSFPFLGPMGGDNFPLQRGKETKNFIPPPVYRLGWPPFPGFQWQMKGPLESPTKHVILLVVTVFLEGDNPMYRGLNLFHKP